MHVLSNMRAYAHLVLALFLHWDKTRGAYSKNIAKTVFFLPAKEKALNAKWFSETSCQLGVPSYKL